MGGGGGGGGRSGRSNGFCVRKTTASVRPRISLFLSDACAYSRARSRVQSHTNTQTHTHKQKTHTHRTIRVLAAFNEQCDLLCCHTVFLGLLIGPAKPVVLFIKKLLAYSCEWDRKLKHKQNHTHIDWHR